MLNFGAPVRPALRSTVDPSDTNGTCPCLYYTLLLPCHSVSACFSPSCKPRRRDREGGWGTWRAAPAASNSNGCLNNRNRRALRKDEAFLAENGVQGSHLHRRSEMVAPAAAGRPSAPASRSERPLSGHRHAQAPPGTASWSARSRQELLQLLAAESELAIKHVRKKVFVPEHRADARSWRPPPPCPAALSLLPLLLLYCRELRIASGNKEWMIFWQRLLS